MEEGHGTYLSVFLNSAFAVGNPVGFFTLFFLFLARILPIISLSPFFGARVLPNPVKVSFALALFVIFLPQLLNVTTTPVPFNEYAVLLLMKEGFIGIVLGYLMSMPFTIATNVGLLIDHQRGGASLMVNDPIIQNQSSPLGTLFNMVLVFIFFLIDGPFLFLNAIMSSYDIIPPDKFIDGVVFDPSSGLYDIMMRLLNKMMIISMQLATPALLAILMTDAFLGIANRLAPQVQITFLGMPLKSLLALVVVCFGWKLFNDELIKQCYAWLDTVNQAMAFIGGTKAPHITP